MTEKGMDEGIELVPIHTVKLGESGDTILMMHGWGQNGASLRILGDLLSKWYQVYLIDLPGFGNSPKPQADWTTIEYAERISSYIDEQGLSPVHVLGHSFGGRVGIRLASRHAEQVKSLILVNSHGLQRVQTGKAKQRSQQIKWMRDFCKFSDRTFGTKIYERWFVPKYGSRDYLAAGAMRNVMVKAVTEDSTEDAKKIIAPTLLLWGEDDQETPVEFANRFHDLIPDSTVVVMPGKDHFPFIDEGAHLCASYILKFFRGDLSSKSAAQKSKIAEESRC
jgi:pimeloyl-ACP methyl ester carboxylesterase